MTATPNATVPQASDILKEASVPWHAEAPLQQLADQMGSDAFALVVVFYSSKANISEIVATAGAPFGEATVIGCSTAGEISRNGYADGEIVAVGLPRDYFRVRTTLIEDLNDYKSDALVDQLVEARSALVSEVPDWPHEFNFLLIDGMSGKEDGFAVTLASGWGPAPLFGGSAGDGTRFQTTYLVHGDRVFPHDTAVIAHIRTRCPVHVFKTDHVTPTDHRMVVTEADPARRLVHEINAEPAAAEYARMVGLPLDEITPAVLGANPVVVKIAGQHYVRGIRNVTDEGSLLFTAAIDEGIVLTLSKTHNIAGHLKNELNELSQKAPLVGVLACDCLYRRTDADENKVSDQVSEILRDYRVFGFSCYGELFNSMHVNQTLTGVAIYAPEGA